MKISRLFIAVTLISVTLIFIKVFFLTKKDAGTSVSPGKPYISAVSVKVIVTSSIENKIYATGTMLSNEEVVLMPEINGRIEKIYFKEGGLVAKGDILVKIENDDLQAQLKKTQSALKLAEEIEARQRKLLEISGVSREEYDMALNKVSTLKAEVDFNSAQLNKSIIKAPFPGLIGLKNISEGSFVNTSVKIATLQQINPIKIDFSIPEKYASMVNTGDAINFTVSGNDSIFTGAIYAKEPRIDQISRTLQLRARCNNNSGILIPGSFAKITLIMKTIENTIMIPTEAIIPELKGQKVFLVKDGVAAPLKVKTGIRTDTEIQITEGLQPGDSLVVSGFMQLRPGAALRIIKEKHD